MSRKFHLITGEQMAIPAFLAFGAARLLVYTVIALLPRAVLPPFPSALCSAALMLFKYPIDLAVLACFRRLDLVQPAGETAPESPQERPADPPPPGADNPKQPIADLDHLFERCIHDRVVLRHLVEGSVLEWEPVRRLVWYRAKVDLGPTPRWDEWAATDPASDPQPDRSSP